MNKEKMFVLLVMFIISTISAYYSTKDIHLKIALQGYGPDNYVTQVMHPENFKRDFMPNTVSVYDNSLVMRVFPLMKRFFDVEPSELYFPFAFIQTFLFVLSISCLSHTLFKNYNITCLCVLIVPLCNLAGLNMARFGNGYGFFSALLYYNYANAFRLFAINYFLKNKYVLTFLMLAISVLCHVTMGGFACIFILSYLIINPKIIKNKQFIIGVGFFIIIVGPFLFDLLTPNNASMNSTIPAAEWIKLTKIFCYHWYPYVMKMFADKAHLIFFPLILTCFYYLLCLEKLDLNDEVHKKILSGLVICAVMTIFGCYASEFLFKPFLIKISFQRSSGLITLFVSLYMISYFYNVIITGGLFLRIIGLWALFLLFFAEPGVALAPLLFLICERLYSLTEKAPYPQQNLRLYIGFCCMLISITAIICIANVLTLSLDFGSFKASVENLWSPFQHLNPLGKYDLLLKGGKLDRFYFILSLIINFVTIKYILSIIVILTISLITLSYFHIKKNVSFSCYLPGISFGGFVIVGMVMFSVYHSGSYDRWKNKFKYLANDYHDAQVWAKSNTDYDALFLLLDRCYGWRDFSERSSFGTIREWGYNGIAYTEDFSLFKKGITRMKIFGIDIEKINKANIYNSKWSIYSNALTKKIIQNYYEMSADELFSICQNNNIDYVVMRKNKTKLKELLTVFCLEYSNSNYAILKVGT